MSVRTTKKIYQTFVQYHVGIVVFYNLFQRTPDDAKKTLVRAGHVTFKNALLNRIKLHASMYSASYTF